MASPYRIYAPTADSDTSVFNRIIVADSAWMAYREFIENYRGPEGLIVVIGKSIRSDEEIAVVYNTDEEIRRY